MSVTQTDPPRAGAPEPDRPGRRRPSVEQVLLAAGLVGVLLVFAIFGKQIVGGIMQGAVKG